MKDIFTDFPNDFSNDEYSGDLRIIKNRESIEQSMVNLITMKPYDNPFHPEISSIVYTQLFENISQITAAAIEKSIEVVIEDFEPRVLIETVSVYADYEGNGYKITIYYKLINSSTPFEFSYFLERIR